MLFLYFYFFFHFASQSLCIHKCIHDEVIQGKTMMPIHDSYLHAQKRLLFGQTIGYGPLRFHLQYNETSINRTDIVGKTLIKIMNIITQFYSQTIQIDYLPSLSYDIPFGFDPNNVDCLTFKVPRRLIDQATPNKDFGLLIEAGDDGDSGVTAYSYPCAYSVENKRPLWGFIHWNLNYLSFSPITFQENIYIGIHQILHVLGFSQILYSSFKNSNIFVNKNGGSYLDGPYLREELKRQYGCQNPPGMSLETNGGSGTAYSHWSRKTANNDLMTAGVSVNNPTISYITLALLEETGWYRRIFKRNGKFINFGFQKGCKMLDPNNCQSDQYCSIKDEKKPDYDQTALGYCKNDSLSNCLYTKYYINFICSDPNYAEKSLHANQGVINITGERGGYRSKCFTSDLRVAGSSPTKYGFRCYQTLCNPTLTSLTIKVGNSFAFCQFPGQEVTVEGYQGKIFCPPSFKNTCAVKRCPQQCNSNGICLNGRCLCDRNYEGQFCDQLSSTGFSSKTNLFLSSQNNNCLIGSYRNQFGECEKCSKNCAKCREQQCLLCLDQSMPVFGFCNG